MNTLNHHWYATVDVVDLSSISMKRKSFNYVKIMKRVAPTPWATGGTCPPFYKWLGTGAPWVEEQQTRNWTNCIDHHQSAHQNELCLGPKSGGARPKNKISGASRRIGAPTFKFVPAPLNEAYWNLSDGSRPNQTCRRKLSALWNGVASWKFSINNRLVSLKLSQHVRLFPRHGRMQIACKYRMIS